MTEIIIAAMLALTCAGTGVAAWACVRMLRSLTRLELALRAMAPQARAEAVPREDTEQERYTQGVANILAYGTREMLRRRGEAQ